MSLNKFFSSSDESSASTFFTASLPLATVAAMSAAKVVGRDSSVLRAIIAVRAMAVEVALDQSDTSRSLASGFSIMARVAAAFSRAFHSE